MLKRTIVFFTLLLFLSAIGGIASAAAPYASVIAYNQSPAITARDGHLPLPTLWDPRYYQHDALEYFHRHEPTRWNAAP